MKKRFCAAALSALMVMASITACGGNSSSSTASGGSASASTGAGDTIKIGGLAPLTGNVAVYGIAVDNGVKLAVKEINENGGILGGKKIEYKVYDEKGDATEAVNAYNKLVQDDKIVALVGDVTSTPTLAVAQAAAQDNIPMITASGTAIDITTTGSNVFRACFTDPFQGDLMAHYAADKLKAKTAAILYNSADDYSLGVAEAFEKAAKEAGVEVVAKEKYTTNDVDFNSQLTTIAGKNPDVLFLPVYYQDVAQIAVQAKKLGIKAKMMGSDGWDGVLDKLDASNFDAVSGALFSSQYSAESTDEGLKKFLADYKAAYNSEANMFAVLGYDAVKMMAQAIDEAGSTDSDAIIEKLAGIQYKGLTGDITFDDERNPIKQAAITTIDNGAYKFVEYYSKKA